MGGGGVVGVSPEHQVLADQNQASSKIAEHTQYAILIPYHLLSIQAMNAQFFPHIIIFSNTLEETNNVVFYMFSVFTPKGAKDISKVNHGER